MGKKRILGQPRQLTLEDLNPGRYVWVDRNGYPGFNPHYYRDYLIRRYGREIEGPLRRVKGRQALGMEVTGR